MDSGPHSGACANAHGGDCYCDCHGAQHGIVHLAGTPAARMAQITARAVTAGGRTHHYAVTRPDGLPPGGGTAEERIAHRADQIAAKTTATPTGAASLPPAVLAHAAKVRASLPTTNVEWESSIPRSTEGRDALRRNIADTEGSLTKWVDRRQAIIDDITAYMIAEGAGPGEITAALTSGHYIDLKSAEDGIAYYTKEIKGLRARLPGEAALEKLIPLRDPNGFAMPTDEVNAHLDSVMAVGNAALDAVHAQFATDPELIRLHALMSINDGLRAIRHEPASPARTAAMKAQRALLPDQFDSHEWAWNIRRRESAIIRDMLASARPMGGATHREAVPGGGYFDQNNGGQFVQRARDDWRERLTAAEQLYPTDWLTRSVNERMTVISADRAFYRAAPSNTVALPAKDHQIGVYNGAFGDSVDETTVHELGHRMEQYIPGLTHLEFAMVRRRSTGPDGALREIPQSLSSLSKGEIYTRDEAAFADEWAHPYAGKTYESIASANPGGSAWELFQVGTQDLYGRGSRKFDNTNDLQAFVLGVLLTLAPSGG